MIVYQYLLKVPTKRPLQRPRQSFDNGVIRYNPVIECDYEFVNSNLEDA